MAGFLLFGPWTTHLCSSASDYTLQSGTLAASCGWNETALLTAYRQGLDPRIRAQMAIYDDNVVCRALCRRP